MSWNGVVPAIPFCLLYFWVIAQIHLMAPPNQQPAWVAVAFSFLSATIASGLVYGLFYVLMTRALRVDRLEVERWFETVRNRLSTSAIPVFEIALPVILGVLRAVYGRTGWRRLLVSLFIGFSVSSLIFVLLRWERAAVPESVRDLKQSIEREVDPDLYRFATDPSLRHLYHEAFETEFVPIGRSGATMYKHSSEVHLLIRKKDAEFDGRFAEHIVDHPLRRELMLLQLFEGDYKETGSPYGSAILMLLFNAGIDLLSITLALRVFAWCTTSITMWRTVLCCWVQVLIAAACYVVALSIYTAMLMGNASVFWTLFLLSLCLPILFCGLSWMAFQDEKSWSWSNFFWIGWVLFCIAWALFSCWAIGNYYGLFATFKASLGAGKAAWANLLLNGFHLPSRARLFAATTLIPVSLATIAFVLCLAAKLTAEPLRYLSWAYMTFVKEEMSGTQAAGVIALFGALTGAIVSIVSK